MDLHMSMVVVLVLVATLTTHFTPGDSLVWEEGSASEGTPLPVLPKRYEALMLLTINSSNFVPNTLVTSGVLRYDGVQQLATFSYPLSHTDVVDFSASPAKDYFWNWNASGVNNATCSTQPFGDGSNRTPFFALSVLPGGSYVGQRVVRYATVNCWNTPPRNTTQCFTQEGLPWRTESMFIGENLWDFAQIVAVDSFPKDTFTLPPCFDGA
eukprot:TRINITY_DN4873_c0_g1_i1.p1 TRINITY_DN4873_c0_g1~~TRINITY_DN4873_c0_g1_i1.p1  ORF type:complete len:211 (-),score=29.55 TRINITY_DN4873_c0_g1_i1:157-789(-)